MMNKSTVYAVHWPEINVFKIGFSERRRWRAFVNRGANLIGLLDDFANASEGYDFEHACHIVSREVCRPGFRTAAEANPYLGNAGGGYVECYQVPGDLMPTEILDFVNSRLAVFHAGA